MEVICTEKAYEGYEIRLIKDDNGEYVIETEKHGEVFRTAYIGTAETRFYNIVMRNF